jgi:hypothetical protein
MKLFKSFNRLLLERAHIWEAANTGIDENDPDHPSYPFLNNTPPEDPRERAAETKLAINFIKKAKYRLMKDYPVTGLVLNSLKICVTYDVRSMAVDAKANIYINPKFLKKITPREALGVLVHESLHVITLTFPRQRNRDMRWWNIATDYVMNYIILRDGAKKDEGFQLPKGGCCPLMHDEIIDGKQRKEGDVFIKIVDENKVEVTHVFNILGKTAEWLYAQIWNILPPHEKISQGPPGGDGVDPDDNTPRVGDPVYNKKTGKYGKVISVDQEIENIEIEEITKEEALDLARPADEGTIDMGEIRI